MNDSEKSKQAMKFLHITDPHLTAPGTKLWGLDAFARFDQCLNDIAKWHEDAEFCFISGDLTDTGDVETYTAINKRLKTFPLETVLMIGNHDLREPYFEVFGETAKDENGFAQSVRNTEQGRFLFLDTYFEPGNSAGEYCDERQEWLRAQLDNAHSDVYIAMHHPPFDIGIPYMDRIKLREHEEFADIVIASGKVKHIFFGHVHRAVFGTWRGINYSALPGLNHQVPLRRETVENSYSQEPPMYAVVTIEEGQTTFHYDAYLDRKTLPDPPQRK